MAPLDMADVWTPFELAGSTYAADWIEREAGQPFLDYDPGAGISSPLTVWAILDDPRISWDLIRLYAYRSN